MEPGEVGSPGGNCDQRLTRIEQILPTLATKEDLTPLATKEELREAVAKLATKDELREAVAKLATKDELREAVATMKGEIREEGDRSRRYMKVLVEELEGKIALYAERVTTLDERDAKQHAESVAADRALETRVTALEASFPKRRR